MVGYAQVAQFERKANKMGNKVGGVYPPVDKGGPVDVGMAGW
jgi:hypothetical protein